MCFSTPSEPTTAPTPAAAPPPPSPLAAPQPITGPRQAQDLQLFGTTQPSTRIDRSQTSGGVGAGGTGLAITG